MKNYSHLLVTFGFVVMIGLSILIFQYSRNHVADEIQKDGFENVSLSIAFWNSHPIYCSGKNTSIYTFKAMKAGKDVTGFACWAGWPWAVHYWVD